MTTTRPEAPTFRFAAAAGFQAELKRRVDEYFARSGHNPRGGALLYAKAAFIALWLVGSYLLLVFAAATWWQAALLALSLGLATAATGFNIQHDGNHGSFSDHRWLNGVTSFALDVIGGSSYVWRYQHNILHHTYTNLAGADYDIDTGGVGRLSPAQRKRWFHRFQQFYLWPMYATIGLKWQLVDDFVQVVGGRIGPQPIPRPRGWDLVGFLAGKAAFLSLAVVVPALFHPLWVVLVVYASMMLVVGFLLAVVFQLAHSVEEAEHPELVTSARLPHEWAAHQITTTVDFARDNPVVTWLVGGLNYQIEHHLFPRVAHVHYPALSRIVEETCSRFGIRYAAHRTFFAAVVSHYRFLRAMGRAPNPDAAAA